MRIPIAIASLIFAAACGTPPQPAGQVAGFTEETRPPPATTTLSTTTTILEPSFAFAKIAEPDLDDLVAAVSAVDPLEFDDAHGFTYVISVIYVDPNPIDESETPVEERIEGALDRDGTMTNIYTMTGRHPIEGRSDGVTYWESDEESWTAQRASLSAEASANYLTLSSIVNDFLLIGQGLWEPSVATRPSNGGVDVDLTFTDLAARQSEEAVPVDGTLRFDHRGTLVEADLAGVLTSTVYFEFAFRLAVVDEPLTVTAPDPALIEVFGFEATEVQNDLRDASAAAWTYYAEWEDFNGTVARFEAIEPSLDFAAVASASQEVVGFITYNDSQAFLFVTADSSGIWWCIAGYANGDETYGRAERLVEVDSLEECSAPRWSANRLVRFSTSATE